MKPRPKAPDVGSSPSDRGSTTRRRRDTESLARWVRQRRHAVRRRRAVPPGLGFVGTTDGPSITACPSGQGRRARAGRRKLRASARRGVPIAFGRSVPTAWEDQIHGHRSHRNGCCALDLYFYVETHPREPGKVLARKLRPRWRGRHTIGARAVLRVLRAVDPCTRVGAIRTLLICRKPMFSGLSPAPDRSDSHRVCRARGEDPESSGTPNR